MPSSMTECHLYFVFNSLNEGHFDLTNTGEWLVTKSYFFFLQNTPYNGKSQEPLKLLSQMLQNH